MRPGSFLRLLAAAAALAAIGGPGAARADEAAVPAGLAIFDRTCAACHQAGGKGTPGVAPPLAGTLGFAASEDGRRYVAGVLTQGLSGRLASRGQVYLGAMPMQAAMTDADLADVANYLARDLNGAAAAPFTPEDFAKARVSRTTHKDLRELRERLLK